MTDTTNDYVLPSNPADRKKIKDALHEMAGALQFIEDKRAFMKDVADGLNENYGVAKKISSKMARVLHKNNYSDVSQESDQFETIFEVLFQGASLPADEDEDESTED